MYSEFSRKKILIMIHTKYVCGNHGNGCPTLSVVQARYKCSYKFPQTLSHFRAWLVNLFTTNYVWFSTYRLHTVSAASRLSLINKTTLVYLFTPILYLFTIVYLRHQHIPITLHEAINKMIIYTIILYMLTNIVPNSNFVIIPPFFFSLQVLIFIVAINLLSLFSLSGIFIY